VEVSRQARAAANTAREPITPPPHITATDAAGRLSTSIAADTATAPPAKTPARKAEKKTTERGHMEKGGLF